MTLEEFMNFGNDSYCDSYFDLILDALSSLLLPLYLAT